MKFVLQDLISLYQGITIDCDTCQQNYQEKLSAPRDCGNITINCHIHLYNNTGK